jgi:hypothetical protein
LVSIRKIYLPVVVDMMRVTAGMVNGRSLIIGNSIQNPDVTVEAPFAANHAV